MIENGDRVWEKCCGTTTILQICTCKYLQVEAMLRLVSLKQKVALQGTHFAMDRLFWDTTEDNRVFRLNIDI